MSPHSSVADVGVHVPAAVVDRDHLGARRSPGSAAPCSPARQRGRRRASRSGRPLRCAGCTSPGRTAPSRPPSTGRPRRTTPSAPPACDQIVSSCVDAGGLPRRVVPLRIRPGERRAPAMLSVAIVGAGPASEVGMIDVPNCTASVGERVGVESDRPVDPAPPDVRAGIGILDLLHGGEVRPVRHPAARPPGRPPTDLDPVLLHRLPGRGAGRTVSFLQISDALGDRDRAAQAE